MNNLENLPIDFSTKYYKLLNNDLNNMSEKELKKHYLNYGINENRVYKLDLEKENINNILPNDFNSENYRLLNNDLTNMNEKELKLHYINHGINEDRVYKLYEEKENINNILPSDFAYKSYQLLNDDLKNMNEYELKLHYINHGINENRIYKLVGEKENIDNNLKLIGAVDISYKKDDDRKGVAYLLIC